MAEDEFAQYRRGGAKPAAEADDFAQYKRAAPAEATPQGSPEISPLKTFIGKAGEAIPFLPQIGAAISAGIQDPSHFREKYLSERQGAQAQTAAGAEQNPNAGRLGTAAGIAGPILATEGLSGLTSLPGAIASAAKGLISPQVLGKAALTAAARALPAGILAGLGLGSSDVTLAKGDIPGAAKQALGDAGTGAATAALLGAGAGARGRQLGQAAEVAGTRTAQSQALDELATAKATRTARVQALKDAAKAKAEAPTRERAVAVFGLDGRQARLGGPEKARGVAQRLYDSPEGQAVLGMAPEDGLAAARKLRQGVGEQLGSVREQLAAIPQASRQLKPIERALEEAAPANQAGREALDEAKAILGRYAGEDGKLGASGLRSAIEDLQAAGAGAKGPLARFYGAAYEAATAAEKGLVAEHLPGQLPAYNQLLGRYGDAKALELGAGAKLERVNRAQAPIRTPRPEAIPAVPKPEYAGPGTLDEAKAATKPQLSAGGRVGRAVVPALGAAIGGSLGYAAGGGGPISYALASAGGTGGGRLGASLARQWFQAVRPTTAGLQEVSTAAAEAVAKHAGTLQAALRSGPTAANAVHRALMASDPDYKEAFKAQASGSVAPIDLSQFQSAWRKPQ